MCLNQAGIEPDPTRTFCLDRSITLDGRQQVILVTLGFDQLLVLLGLTVQDLDQDRHHRAVSAVQLSAKAGAGVGAGPVAGAGTRTCSATKKFITAIPIPNKNTYW